MELDLGRGKIGGAPPRPAVDLDQRVGILHPGRHDPARAVIFEGARDQPLARGKQGGGERIPGKSLVTPPIEGESERLAAIDPPPLGQPEGRAHAPLSCRSRPAFNSCGGAPTG